MAWLPLVDAQSTLPSQTQTRPVVKTSSLDGDVDVQSKKRLDEIEAQYRKRLDDEKTRTGNFQRLLAMQERENLELKNELKKVNLEVQRLKIDTTNPNPELLRHVSAICEHFSVSGRAK